MEKKKRVEWGVGLYPYNLSDEPVYYPRVSQRGSVTLDELAAELERRTGIYRRDSVKAIVSIMESIIEDYLIDGYAVSGKLGTLSPSVTGMWNFDRLSPAARAENRAVVRYTMSPHMKESFDNPLFHTTVRGVTGPSIGDIKNMYALSDGRETWRSRDLLIISGRYLLMNGDLPERGLYFIDAVTGEVAAHLRPEDLLQHGRCEIIARVPELPDGRYRLRIVSQCTTSPRPLRHPKTAETHREWTITAE